MGVSRFRVSGRGFGKTSAREATVTIDRDRGFFTVRPLHSHRTYELLLADVAENVVWRVLTAEHKELKAAKKMRRGA